MATPQWLHSCPSRESDDGFQQLQHCGPNTAHASKFIKRTKRTQRIAISNNARGQRRANARQQLEIAGCCNINVNKKWLIRGLGRWSLSGGIGAAIARGFARAFFPARTRRTRRVDRLQLRIDAFAGNRNTRRCLRSRHALTPHLHAATKQRYAGKKREGLSFGSCGHLGSEALWRCIYIHRPLYES